MYRPISVQMQILRRLVTPSVNLPSSIDHNNMDDYISELAGANSNSYLDCNINEARDRAFYDIENFKPERLCVDASLIDYWTVKEKTHLTLSRLAKIVHATPATQISVERCFSSLKLLLSDQKNLWA